MSPSAQGFLVTSSGKLNIVAPPAVDHRPATGGDCTGLPLSTTSPRKIHLPIELPRLPVIRGKRLSPFRAHRRDVAPAIHHLHRNVVAKILAIELALTIENSAAHRRQHRVLPVVRPPDVPKSGHRIVDPNRHSF